ncbi:unnamed protein product [Discosporangium mesarthrocarpum]
MESLLEGGTDLFDLDARGDSYDALLNREDEHPVLEVLRKRIAAGSKPGERRDNLKVGLAIEGGGMRGCVSAGMIASVVTLGLMDTFDAVYGSSAGSLVGTYAIAGQECMPRLGCSVYYDALTGPGRHFIDTRYIFRAMGLGLLGTLLTRWRGLWELLRQASFLSTSYEYGSPVLKLDYLLYDVVENQRPLDWDRFWSMQEKQPLHVIASAVKSGKSISMSSRRGHFSTLRELTNCMRASMLLPGITGPMVNLPGVDEPLVDSQLYEPIPFRTALKDGCTHVVVLRSRPDGANLVGKPKLAEKMIMRRFFKRKNKMADPYYYMKHGGHKNLYAKAVLTLNKGARATAEDEGPYLLPLSLSEMEGEVPRLERGRAEILTGVRKGYQHAHDVLKRTTPEDPTSSIDGWQAAMMMFPDSILEADADPVVAKILEEAKFKDQKSEVATVTA